MKKILLICSAGMSTSLLVNKMVEYCEDEELEMKIEAKAINIAQEELEIWDVILLGPQVGSRLDEIKRLTSKPVAIIPKTLYGQCDGEETVLLALDMLNDNLD